MFEFITKYFKKEKTKEEFSLLIKNNNETEVRSLTFGEIDQINRKYFNACISNDLDTIKELFNQPHTPDITFVFSVDEVITHDFSEILSFLIEKAKEQNYIFSERPQDYNYNDKYFDIKHFANCCSMKQSEKCFDVLLPLLFKNYKILCDLRDLDFRKFISIFDFEFTTENSNMEIKNIKYENAFIEEFKNTSFLSLLIKIYPKYNKAPNNNFYDDFESFCRNYYSNELFLRDERKEFILNQYKIFYKSFLKDKLETKLNIKDVTEKVNKT